MLDKPEECIKQLLGALKFIMPWAAKAVSDHPHNKALGNRALSTGYAATKSGKALLTANSAIREAKTGPSSIPLSLVFEDLRRNGIPIYGQEHLRLTSGNLHSGSTFPGTITLDAEDEEYFNQMLVSGLQIVFWTSFDK